MIFFYIWQIIIVNQVFRRTAVVSKLRMTSNIKNTGLTITLLTVQTCYVRDNQLFTKKIIQEIAKNNYAPPCPGGFMHGETPRYNLNIFLKETATTEELIKYTDDKRPVVSTYTFKCSDEGKYDKLFQIAVRQIQDTAKDSFVGHISEYVYDGAYFAIVNPLNYVKVNDFQKKV